jgi:hypothetical protein
MSRKRRPLCFATCTAEESTCESAIDYLPRSVDPDGGLTRVLLGKFVTNLRKGHRRTVTCDLLGVPWGTYQLWIRTGTNEINEYDTGRRDHVTIAAEFVVLCNEAVAAYHAQLVDEINEAEDPVVKLRLAKARFPKHYHHDGRTIIDDEAATEVVRVDPFEALESRIRQLRTVTTTAKALPE